MDVCLTHRALVLCAGRPSRPVIIEPLLDVLEDTTFTLKWRRPEEDGGDADISYKVRYASVATSDESTEKKELKTSSQEIEVRDLELSTQYLVEVFAINAGGESDPATRLYQSPNIEGENFLLYHFNIACAASELMFSSDAAQATLTQGSRSRSGRMDG